MINNTMPTNLPRIYLHLTCMKLESLAHIHIYMFHHQDVSPQC